MLDSTDHQLRTEVASNAIEMGTSTDGTGYRVALADGSTSGFGTLGGENTIAIDASSPFVAATLIRSGRRRTAGNATSSLTSPDDRPAAPDNNSAADNNDTAAAHRSSI